MEKIWAKDRLKQERIEQGYNAAELGRLAGITRQGYLNIEKKHHGAAPKTAKSICRVLGVEWGKVFKLGNGREG